MECTFPGWSSLYREINLRKCTPFYMYIFGIVAVPSQPNITVASVTNTSIFISWSVPSGLVVDSYEVTWISHECPHDIDQGNETISGASYRYTIEGLRGGTSYNITVSATNSADTVYSDTVTGETKERGQGMAIIATRKYMYLSYANK